MKIEADKDTKPSRTIETPTVITRRSFIKRSTATAVVAVLALQTFRSEALAVESGGSSDLYMLEVTAWPLPTGISESIVTVFDKVITNSGAWKDGKTLHLTLTTSSDPKDYFPTTLSDDSEHYIYSAASITFSAVFTITQGGAVIGSSRSSVGLGG